MTTAASATSRAWRGSWCTALGYGNEEIVDAAAAAMRKVSFTHAFSGKSHDGVIELSEKLKEISPVPRLQGALRHLGLRGQRHADQAVVVLQQCARQAREEEDHLAHARLSWRHHRLGLAHRASLGADRFRPAHRQCVPHLLPAPLPLRPGRRERGGTSPPAWRRTSRTSSSRKAPTPSPPSSPSRSWAPAASSCRPRAISRRSMPSSPSTTSASSPTR